MRLHSLQISAFGPFAETSDVDFDKLSAAGLFLLSGATGSGKTSVLDAVCFALYGDVPGDRSAAKRLRADQARPEQPPRVTLEATLSGRRFRFVRSPQWERPKKRGTGTTVEQASVVVSERMKGQWITLSTRLDEAGHLVGNLVGMNLTQFTQVAMLPQGRFQTFLRARSEDRHALLQKLFRTGRFEDVERWLRDRRGELRREAAQGHHDIADLVSRISEATESPLGEGWDIHDLAPVLQEGAVGSWVTARADACVEESATTAQQVATTGLAEAAARTRLEEATVTALRRRRLAQARSEHDLLAAVSEEHRQRQRVLADARRAAPLTGPLRGLDTALAARRQAGTRWVAARAAAEVLVPGLATDPEDDASTADRLETCRRLAADRAASARALQPRERELARLQDERTRLLDQEAATATQQQLLEARAGALPEQIVRAGAAVHASEVADRALLTLRPEHADLTARLQAARQAASLATQVEGARLALLAASEAKQDRRRDYLDVREARLTSMAAEIAGALAVGASCPVCGSCDHPHKASSAPGAVDEEAEHAAQKALDDAQLLEHLRDGELRDLRSRITTLRERAGERTLAELEHQVDQLSLDLRSGELLAEQLDGCRTALAGLQDELARLVTSRHDFSVASAARASRVESLDSGVDALLAELSGALDGTGQETLAALVDARERETRALDDALKRHADLAHCQDAAERAAHEVATQLTEAGFSDRAGAEAAMLPPAEADRLAAAGAEHDRRSAAVQALLAEFASSDDRPDDEVSPDLDELARLHQQVAADLGDARAAAARATARAARLSDLGSRLDLAVEAWRPLSDELDLVTGVSTFAEGRSADNRLQMRLSAYVLAHRLSQVVAAANERLSTMSDQRYSLEHTAQRGAGETRGGLSLLVRDDWSGESRDPATLSGGETFVVSLALALGLADVITQEAGGADLDTLFVDEGFGSLDADTLDDVMDTLDTLRDGGRVVGVVSHVAEMRDRIPTRLLVAKSRTGSTLTQVP